MQNFKYTNIRNEIKKRIEERRKIKMLWFILGLIITVIIILYCFTDNWYGLGEKIGYSILIFLVVMLLAFMCLLFTSLICECTTPEDGYNWEITETENIIALRDNQNITGAYYIFSGYIDEDLYYYYAKETQFGYKTDKIKASRSYIKYTDEAPKIETYSAISFKSKFLNLIAAPTQSRTILYCPENTITTEFNIDLE